MALCKTKWVTLVIAACFAILQAMQPLIHAHLDTEHPIHTSGFHVGDEHEEVVHASSVDASLSEVPHVSHTISVASGIKKDIDLGVLDSITVAVIFIVLALLLPSSNLPQPSYIPNFRRVLRRRLPAPRAPPLF